MYVFISNCFVQFCPVDHLITEHMIIVAGTRKTGMKHKLLIMQENWML